MNRKFLFLLILLANTNLLATTPLATDWMRDLNLGDRPLNQVTLPGTHDSGTYNILSDNAIAKNEDIPAILNTLNFAIGPILAGWSKAQYLSIDAQLKYGVRFFDLRVTYRDDTKSFWISHGQYSIQLDDAINDISSFLKKHESEIVLIKIGNLRYMPGNSHEELIQKLFNAFGDRYVGTNYRPKVKVGQLWNDHKQVLIFYDSGQYVGKSINNVPADFLWSSSTGNLFFPWVNEQSVEKLWQGEQRVANEWYGMANDPALSDRFFGLGPTISPDGNTIAAGINPLRSSTTPTNLQELAGKVNEMVVSKMLPALKQPPFLTEKTRPNIITLDWASPALIHALVELNRVEFTPKALGGEEKTEDRLISGQPCISDHCLVSQANGFKACQQGDGNLAVYNSEGKRLWANNKNVTQGKLCMQGDGNLVSYDSNDKPYWGSSSNGKGQAPYSLIMQNDGNLVIYDGSNMPIWSTGTVQK